MDERDRELIRIALDARRNAGAGQGPPPGLWQGPPPGGYPPPAPYQGPAYGPPPPGPSGGPTTEDRIIDRLLKDEPGPTDPTRRTTTAGNPTRRRDPVDLIVFGLALWGAAWAIWAALGGALWID